MKSADYLIWVGQSYSGVLCGSKKSTCTIPFKKGLSHCYIHEAEWRGCCRKVPQIPPLAITGRTRIFLAHRDRLQKKEQGRIFGYYILKGIEVIKGVGQPLSMPLQNFRKIKTLQGTVMEAQCWDGSKIKTSTIIDERSPLIEPCPECEEGAIKEKKCDDGKVITTHECVDGYWEKTNEKCDDNGDEDECEDGEFIFQLCDKGDVVSHICVDGKWEETGAECPERNPPEQTMFEPERACSLRLKPGSVYFVDALTSDITAHFRENLKKENLKESYLKAKTESEKEALIKRGRKLFVDTVADVKMKRNIYTKIPGELTNKAELRGEFVFFNNKTVFEKYPSASFLGILSVDGDKIIEQVSEGKSKIKICYCGEDWVSALAEATKSSKAFVKRFLKNLIKIAKKELKSKEEFKIPDFGRFYVVETKERNGRNPATGEKIIIPKKKRVKFKPYKNLKNFAESDS
jgi:nucleoid DNA-binding protein